MIEKLDTGGGHILVLLLLICIGAGLRACGLDGQDGIMVLAAGALLKTLDAQRRSA